MRTCLRVTIVFVILFLLYLSAQLLGLSIMKLDSTEMGVMYDKPAKKLGGVYGEGLHVGPVGMTFIKYPSIMRQETFNTTCFLKDGLVLDTKVAFNWRPIENNLLEITKLYRNYDEQRKVVMRAAQASVEHMCGKFTINQVKNNRAGLEEKQSNELQAYLDELWAEAGELKLSNVGPPRAWASLVEEKESAEADINIARQQESQKLTTAETKYQQALEQAKVIEQRAETKAQSISQEYSDQAAAITEQYRTQAQRLQEYLELDGTSADQVAQYLVNRIFEQRKNVVYNAEV